jgi:oxaloacetate decarboxylase alpha subunit
MRNILKSGSDIYNTTADLHGPAETYISVSSNNTFNKVEPEKQMIDNKRFMIYEETVESNDQTFHIFKSNNKYFVKAKADTFEFESLEKIELFDLINNGSSSGGGLVYPPMPGSVVAVERENGDKVKAGDTIMIIEAMKMETTLKAESDGIVTKLTLKPGDRFDTDTVLYSIEAIKNEDNT